MCIVLDNDSKKSWYVSGYYVLIFKYKLTLTYCAFGWLLYDRCERTVVTFRATITVAVKLYEET